MLILDTREPEKIENYIKKLNIEYKKEALPIGDFVCKEKDIVIERKTIEDFAHSIRSGHLTKQLLQMQENFSRCYLLISGSLKDSYFKGLSGWTVEHHVGSLCSIAVRYNIKILILDNDKQLISAVNKIINKTDDGRILNIKDTSLLKNCMYKTHIALRLLCSFEGIGLKTAEKKILDPEIDKAVNALMKLMIKE